MPVDRMTTSVENDETKTRGARMGGFTLLEVIIALALMIVLLAGVYGFYATCLRSRNEGGQVMREIKRMRAELQRIADDICYATNVLPGDGTGFSGGEKSITIVRFAMPSMGEAYQRHNPEIDQLPAAQLDIVRIGYELIWDDKQEDDEGVKICHGLLRSYQRTFDPNPQLVIQNEDASGEASEQEQEHSVPQATVELIAPEIKYLKFEYFDGAEWQDRWHVATPEPDKESGKEGDEGVAESDGEELAEEAESALAASTGGSDDDEYVLPQAVKITIGKIREDPEQDKLDVTQLKETEERRELEEHHSDRLTIIVYLPQADQTLLSSRKYGLKSKLGRESGDL